MTQISANRWWNTLVDFAGNLDETPKLPTPQEMVHVCNEISPICYVYLHDQILNKDFWIKAMDILKRVTKIDPFPDPRYNFRLFLLYFYTFREFLKPLTVETCILYAQSFCPIPAGNFFIDTFIYAVSDPVLVIKTFHKLNDMKNPQWVSFISQPGKAERFFDLFSPCIGPQTEQETLKLTIKVYLADLLIDIFVNHLDMALFNTVAMSFYKALTDLIRSVDDYDAVPFLRNVFTLELILSKKSDTSPKFFFDKYSKRLSQSYIFRSLFYNWCFEHLYSIKPSNFVNFIVKLRIYDLCTFSVLEKISLQYPNETSVIIVQFLSSIQFRCVQWMQIASKIMATIFSSGNFPAPVKKWFETYIFYAFMVIRIMLERNKYRKRLISFLAILSSDDFMSIEWVREIIMKNASYSYSSEDPIIGEFFDVKETYDAEWKSSYDKYKSLSPIKNLPFKKNSDSLIMFGDDDFFKYVYDDCDPKVAQFGASPSVNKFLIYDEELQLNDQRQVIFSLEDYVESEMSKIKTNEEILNQMKFDDTTIFLNTNKHLLNGLILICKEINKSIFEFQKNQIQTTIDNANDILKLIQENRQLSVNMKSMALYNDRVRLSDQNFIILKRQKYLMKAILLNEFANARNTLKNLKSLNDYLSAAIMCYNFQLSYSPASEFDDYLARYIDLNESKELVANIVDSIKKSNVDFVKKSIENICQKILNAICVTSMQKKSILTISLIRYFFSLSYFNESELDSFKEENVLFQRRAVIMSKKPLCTLNLSDGLIPNSYSKTQIRAFFRGKKVPTVYQIEFETNPVDIMFSFNNSVKHYIQLLNNPNTTESDVESIAYALTIVNPPSNSYSIMKFLQKWSELYTTKDFSLAAQYFIRTVQSVFSEK